MTRVARSSTHRAHGHALANGTPPNEVMTDIGDAQLWLELSDEDWNRLDAEAQQAVDAAVEFAKAGTDPDPADALNHVDAEDRDADPRPGEKGAG